MNKEDIDFLISIQSLPDEDFQIAYLERELEKKENIIKEIRELVEQYSWNTYYYQCPSSRRYFKSEIISDLKQILDKKNK